MKENINENRSREKRTLLLTLAYDGRDFHGWQIQHNANTVQNELQKALRETLGELPPIKGCSRTDAGVHARCFCVSLETSCSIPCERLPLALNCRLPRTIAVLSCREVPEGFHARYSAKGKQYTYDIWNSPCKNPFLVGQITHVPAPLDAERMRENGLPLLGSHDFRGFQAAGSDVRDTVRTITRFDVTRTGDTVRITVAADGFLYNMVRIIAGTLIDMERGRIPCGTMAEIIESGERERAGFTAPPDGLYLDDVFYDI